MLHSIGIWLSQPANAAVALGWAALVASELLPFTKGRANGLIQGLVSLLTKAKAMEEEKK
jgi:hypothetical protein